jgi:hypothetical protein
MPTDDPLFNKGIIRQDGRKLHPLYLFQVKDPAQIQGTVGYLHTCHDHSGRSGFSPTERRGMPAKWVPSVGLALTSEQPCSSAVAIEADKNLGGYMSRSKIFPFVLGRVRIKYGSVIDVRFTPDATKFVQQSLGWYPEGPPLATRLAQSA